MKWLTYLILLVAAWVVSAWVLMVTVGVVHAEWIPQLPTIGFGVALLLASLTGLRAVLGAVFKAAAESTLGVDR